ncbi:MAG: hypothetical protein V3T23_09730 [Nitrososphaerales archaeon]|nr:hypothetical protein [Deltaproteobacteria bacterium]
MKSQYCWVSMILAFFLTGCPASTIQMASLEQPGVQQTDVEQTDMEEAESSRRLEIF